jgi:hypothetical protein
MPREKPATVEAGEVAVPPDAEVHLSMVAPRAVNDEFVAAGGTVVVTKLEAKRGGDVALTWKGKVAGGSRAFDVSLEVSTFVRDVVKPQ